jgi:hypothetical protein
MQEDFSKKKVDEEFDDYDYRKPDKGDDEKNLHEL